MSYDWFEQIPKAYGANIEWRKKAVARSQVDEGYRRMVRWQCGEDMLYFLNGWAWLHEPRLLLDREGNRKPHVLPFLTREHQDEYIRKIEAALGVRSIGVQKCREEGFSWMFCYFAVRDFAFKQHVDIGLGSSTEKKSDLPGYMGSLLGKIDWAIEQLPPWFLGQKGRRRGQGDWFRDNTEHCFIHNRLHNSITGYAATGEGPRSGRYFWYFFDEFGTREWQREGNDKKAMEAVGATTPSKAYVSTPEGEFGEFHRIMTEDSALDKIVMNWRNNKEKAFGEYRLVKGVPVAVDPINNPLEPQYNPPSPEVKARWERLRRKGFNLEEDTRSEWYDNECDQPEASPEMIAKNVDGKFGGSIAHVFDDEFFQVAHKTCETPHLTGTLHVHDDGQWKFERDAGGQFLLWCPLDEKGLPPKHSYIVCADLGHGRGGPATSNSAMHVIDVTTRTQVLEFASNIIPPENFADICIATCRWFHNAQFAWEANQPGNVCIGRVRNANYPHYYKRKTLDRMQRVSTEKPGFWTDDSSKPLLFSGLRLAVKSMGKSGGIIIRSKYLVEECGQYIRDPKTGKIKHAADGPGHGDRVIAFSVGNHALSELPINAVIDEKKTYDPNSLVEPPPGTFAHLLWQQKQISAAPNNREWNIRSTASMAHRSNVA